MNSKEVRNTFLKFFESKGHKIVSSAPMVVKDDPTLMFTNAGMNQFKDYFLGNKESEVKRIADTQKCLRVSGKHNDLEEVGHDTYHHTMFEMLGNWSFGNYFKQEAIDWAWELLTDVYKITKENLYVTVFEGDKKDNIPADNEALNIWKKHVPEDRILYGNKKDNFWEMGDTGPCGPCSEIHIDIRSDEEKAKISGRDLVNKDHPEVIEIWNLVFIEFNRKADSSLVKLPEQHVDTGMGFERLCMVMQNKRSNYQTDVFTPLINRISDLANYEYGSDNEKSIAVRVISDHIRAVAFSIADGQLPSNNKAGYVIRRILRRAVRYGYTFLDFREPFIYKLVDTLAVILGEAYPELLAQKELITKVILEEEQSFLRTLEHGIRLLDGIIDNSRQSKQKIVSGKIAFELYDTYGFPLDLTQLILRENELEVDLEEFDAAMKQQKDRSRNAASIDKDDWVILLDDEDEEFIGYDYLEAEIKITRYRRVKTKNKEIIHAVFNITPFYAESGGQVGDSGTISSENETIRITNTVRENELIIHIIDRLPSNPNDNFKAIVEKERRQSIANNHSATHLLHEGLREVLGNHVEQKGSLVSADYFRFDFSHFEKVSAEDLLSVEQFVNQRIRMNLACIEERQIPLAKAIEKGAMSLFGEKYGDVVRMIQFGDSIELCGGTHVDSTGNIGTFKIISEGAIASGIRRIEAISGETAEKHIHEKLETLENLRGLLRNPKDPVKGANDLLSENTLLKKELEDLKKEQIKALVDKLDVHMETINDIKVVTIEVDTDMNGAKDLAFKAKSRFENVFLVIATQQEGKVNLTVSISDKLIETRGLHAGNIIRTLAKEIKGGGGGQAFFATAGGSDAGGIQNAFSAAREIIKSL